QTGSMFFVPTIDFLDDPPPLPADELETSSLPTVYHGSLPIGSEPW
ncbi:peroxidase, partial [Mycobacterium sp. ITM-2017-0098]